MKLDMSISPSIKREFSSGAMKQGTSSGIPIRKSTFFSIDQILGMKEKRRMSDDEETFGKEVSDSDSFNGDKYETDLCNDDDVELVEEPVDDDETMNMNDDKEDEHDGKDEKNGKQTPSYTAIIAQAILSSSDKKLPLGCIYEYIAENFPEFLKKGQGWRNCVRHNLSLSECFIKAGRARNGRGNYWGIHPRYVKNFSKGDFRKRRASHRPRNRDLSFGYGIGRYYPYYLNPYGYVSQCGYNKPPLYADHHRAGFSVDNILSKEQRRDSAGPPVLSNYKYWKPEEGHVSPPGNRTNIRFYSPPVLSASAPTSYQYIDHHGYRSYEPHRTESDCSCHKHACRSPRT